MDLAEHLFRHEAGRLVAILTRLFGIHNLALAEDVVQDAFCQALETWKFHGVPKNPSAWLLQTAKRRAIDVLRREGTARKFAPELGRFVASEWTLTPTVDEAFDAAGIRDVQLRMMFSCVHPTLPLETQVALVLHLLCGFSIDEIAAAFLKNGAAMGKRLARAKQTLARTRDLFDLAGSHDAGNRLPGVLRALYLLFNEGYHGASREAPIRRELCDEARRLIALLLENPLTCTPAVHALASLCSFLAARLPARMDEDGNLLLLADQERSRWDRTLIAEGRRQLDLSAAGPDLTSYHIEAAIASVHAEAASVERTDWDRIVALYGTLLLVQPSPVVALNRAVAIGERDGAARGLEEIGAIEGRERLLKYPFYFTALAEFELRLGRHANARRSFAAALRLARNADEKRFLERRIAVASRPTGPQGSTAVGTNFETAVPSPS